jgi:signal transduction histidine kinase
MAILRTWWLPVSLGLLQLALWPGRVLLTHEPADPVKATIAVVLTVLIVAALGRRRDQPVPALSVVVVALMIAMRLAPDVDDLFFIAWADLIALYSVAARRPARAAAWSGLGVLLGQAVQLTRPDVSVDETLFSVPLSVIGCGLTVALGRARGRWRRGRAEAAERLARAEAERRRAANAERERLARELHDVTAHHLTAIVVHAGAARRLASSRPELIEPALEFAAETGRRTLTALHRLVAMIASDQEPETAFPLRLDGLAAAAGRVGQPVRLELIGPVASLAAETADAVHAVVREAITNAMRYAAGAAITATVAVVGPQIEVLVTNGPSANGPERLGSGRGLAGLAARLDAFGGSVQAGPDLSGGWRVSARLPRPAETTALAETAPAETTALAETALAETALAETALAETAPAETARAETALARVPAAPGMRQSWWRSVIEERLVDLAVTAFAILVPVLFLLIADTTEPDLARFREPDLMVLMALLLILHGLPVWWRRTAPWRVAFAVALVDAAYIAVIVVMHLPGTGMLFLLSGLTTEVVLVYAVAAYGRPKWATWIAIGAGFALPAEQFVLISRSDDVFEPQTPPADATQAILVLTLGVIVLSMVLHSAVWLTGFLLRLSGEKTLATEAAALARTAALAEAAADGQRARFAAGLRASVLEPAERLIGAATPDRGPADPLEALDRVIAEARAGLAAMRELLGALQPLPPRGSAPPRGTADLAVLCAERREAGRAVTLAAEAPPYPLPVAVDLSGYRIVDAALDTDDADACAVAVRFVEECLVVTVSGVPSATSGSVAARIRARVAALGGTATFEPAGTVAVRLPAAREEVPASIPG